MSHLEKRSIDFHHMKTEITPTGAWLIIPTDSDPPFELHIRLDTEDLLKLLERVEGVVREQVRHFAELLANVGQLSQSMDSVLNPAAPTGF